ncbi:MAG: Gfo/Idh/MocA family oxidoreductase [Oscillospiraceae bacterium]|nr:Gfo/Idh/MocA family oxidoreductase [Oscillospiraceae bacterium]MCI9308846.1 Gfo/Idh/MocA family oxidoreductase [Oscillospiraceae bacterium]MCI9549090.1 Gfo/Idh/MocA family oxidoreductase [Oscillospiraceae bacterium]
MKENRQLRWAVLGAGVIANEMAQALRAMGRTLDAVGSRTYEKAAAFAETYGVKKVYADYHQMFTDPDIDAIYLTTPHNTHMAYLEQALSQGKHVLCEKSITLNSAELDRAMKLAEEHHVVLAEAMTIYHMPLYRVLRERLASGELGKVNLIQLNFGSFKDYDMSNRFFNRDLAGGAMLDIGVYALSLARLFLDSSPDQVKSFVRKAPTGVDESAVLSMMNREGQLVSATLSLHSKQPKRAVISCERGYIEIMEYPRADEAVIVDAAAGARETVRAGETARALVYELEDMEAAVRGEGDMSLSCTADVMELMTALRREWGVSYPEEA